MNPTLSIFRTENVIDPDDAIEVLLDTGVNRDPDGLVSIVMLMRLVLSYATMFPPLSKRVSLGVTCKYSPANIGTDDMLYEGSGTITEGGPMLTRKRPELKVGRLVPCDVHSDERDGIRVSCL